MFFVALLRLAVVDLCARKLEKRRPKVSAKSMWVDCAGVLHGRTALKASDHDSCRLNITCAGSDHPSV